MRMKKTKRWILKMIKKSQLKRSNNKLVTLGRKLTKRETHSKLRRN